MWYLDQANGCDIAKRDDEMYSNIYVLRSKPGFRYVKDLGLGRSEYVNNLSTTWCPVAVEMSFRSPRNVNNLGLGHTGNVKLRLNI